MNRRTFIQTSAALLSTAVLASDTIADKTFAQHLAGQIVSAPDLPILPTQRAPFGWKTVTIAANNPSVVCTWSNLAKEITPTHLRLAIGLDERDEKTVEMFLPKSGRIIGCNGTALRQSISNLSIAADSR